MKDTTTIALNELAKVIESLRLWVLRVKRRRLQLKS